MTTSAPTRVRTHRGTEAELLGAVPCRTARTHFLAVSLPSLERDAKINVRRNLLHSNPRFSLDFWDRQLALHSVGNVNFKSQ